MWSLGGIPFTCRSERISCRTQVYSFPAVTFFVAPEQLIGKTGYIISHPENDAALHVTAEVNGSMHMASHCPLHFWKISCEFCALVRKEGWGDYMERY